MTARFASLSTRAQVAVIAAALLLVALIGYFAVIAPKRSTASDLKKQTAAVQSQIDQNRSTGFTQALPAVRAASVFSVAKAMPTQLKTPEVILQLDELAVESGISFDQIQPVATDSAAATVTTGTTPDPFAVEPIQVEFAGSFYNLVTFLQRMRNLVRVQNGNLFTAGRLFDVSNVSFQEGPKGWPQVQATLTINEFVPQAASSATTAPALGSTDTTSTTTNGTTTTSNPTSATASTSGGS